MATTYKSRVEGLSTNGDPRIGPCGIGVNGKVGKVTYLKLIDTAGVEWFLWFDTTGQIRTATDLPANPNTGGTVVS